MKIELSPKEVEEAVRYYLANVLNTTSAVKELIFSMKRRPTQVVICEVEVEDIVISSIEVEEQVCSSPSTDIEVPSLEELTEEVSNLADTTEPEEKEEETFASFFETDSSVETTEEGSSLDGLLS